MKKFTTLCTVLVLATSSLFAATSTTQSFELDGHTRSYLQYIPSSYNATQPSTVLVMMHGLNGDMNSFANLGYDLGLMADANNTIVLSLQALDEQNTEVANFISTIASFQATTFSNKGVWGAGVSIPLSSVTAQLPPEQLPLLLMLWPEIAASGKVVLNQNVNDIAYINAVIDATKTAYNINTDRLFMFGASMGGAMAYKYALSASPQISGMAIGSGFIGAEVNTSGAFPVPTIHFHGTDDDVVEYNGTEFNGDIESIISLLAAKNHTASPEIINIPNSTIEDNKTVTVSDYQTVGKPRLTFYKIEGADHGLTNITDISVFAEAWKFFNNEPILTAIANTYDTSVSITPNPSSDYIQLSVAGKYTLFTLEGKVALQGNNIENEAIWIGDLPQGMYIITIMHDGANYASKLSIN